jgi:hypothetical protein
MARSRRACPERSRRNPGDASFPHAARSFSITGPVRFFPGAENQEVTCISNQLPPNKIVILSGAPHRFVA